MKSLSSFSGLLICLSFLMSCGVKNISDNHNPATPEGGDLHNSMNSLDWEGVYTAILPCADCEGIQTALRLNDDLTYVKQTIYLGESDEVYEESGAFSWSETGSTITLQHTDKEQASKYFVGENHLTQLDIEGKKIQGDLAEHYIFRKIPAGLTEKYWKLKSINGKPVVWEEGYQREPHIIFKTDNNKVVGHGGCNGFSGKYELRKANKISISQVVSTRMMCSHMDTEMDMLKALNEVDNYEVNGDHLLLYNEKSNPLASFEVVYLR